MFEQPAGKIQIGFPAIVKPVAECASLGIDLQSVVSNPEELLARVAYVIERYQQPALAEVFIPEREFAVALWGNEPVEDLPIAEEDYGRIPDPLECLLTYDAQWISESPFYQNIFNRCPAELPREVEARLIETCVAADKAIGLRDFGRGTYAMRTAFPISSTSMTIRTSRWARDSLTLLRWVDTLTLKWLNRFWTSP